MIDDDEPLNQKDITKIVSGDVFNFDEETGDIEKPEPEQPQDGEIIPQEMHPLVGIMDMLISSTSEPLRRHGYPQPNLSIWNEWGKPNLSKAFHQYMPTTSGAGAAVNSPLFAGLLGAGALVLAFLPVIMYHMQRKREEEEAEAVQIEQHRGNMEPTATATQPLAPVTAPAPTPTPTPAPAPAPKPAKEPEPVKKIKTADNPAPNQIIKLPGGGDEAPSLPMFEIIARNMEQQPI